MFRYVSIVLIVIKSANAGDLSILRQNDSLYCMISNDSINSAITWDTGYDTISYKSYRITEDLQKSKWQSENSLKNEFKFGPILDYRWESFPVNNECIYEMPSRNPFEIYISMQGTVIYLCENKEREQCYTINFGAEGPSRGMNEPRGNCRNYKKPHKTKWLHFTLKADDRFFKIKQYGKKADLHVAREQYFGKYLVIDGRWKIHALNAYSSNSKSNQEIKLVNDFSKTEGICLGLFVHVCNTCTVILKLYDRNNVEIDSTLTTKKSQWEELKVCGKVYPSTNMKLSITATSPLSEKVYIADNIRKFGKKDIRLTILRNVEDQSESHCCYDVMLSKEFCTTELSGYTPLPPDVLCQSDVHNITTLQNGTILDVRLIIGDCAQHNGFTHYNLDLLCTSQWCSTNDSVINITSHITDDRSTTYNFTVLGNTNYTIKVRAYRNSSHVDTIKQILTSPTEPKAVRDVTAYWVTNTSIQIRWSEPYPPTGLLEEYYVARWDENPANAKQRFFKANSSFCAIWKNQICSSFDPLLPDTLYTFRIQAKNVNVSNFGSWKGISATTENKEPSGPENLAYIWNETTNALILTWDHPSIPNGRITHFSIFKSMQQIEAYNDFVEEFQYTYQIQYDKLNVSSSEDIMIHVYAFNSIGKQNSTLLVSTPPKTPIFLEDPILLNITTNSVKIRVSQIADIDGERSILYVIVTPSKDSEANSKQNTDDDNVILKEANISMELNSWIASNFSLDKSTVNTSREIFIGGETQKQLDSEKMYAVTLVLRNEYRNISRYSTHTLKITTPAGQNYKLLLFFLVIPVVCFIIFIIYKRKNKATTTDPSTELQTENTLEELELPSTNSNRTKLSTVQEKILAKNEKYSNPIKLQDLQEYVKQCLENQEFEKQYESIQVGQTKEWKYGMISENKAKNRYKNVAAYDDTRVKLKTINNDPHSDYINANYIDGYDIKRSYIATQGPKSNTINDFWRMIWEENVQYIIMIANIIEGGKKRVEKYWPDINETKKYGDIMVTLFELTVFPEYENKILKISSKGEERSICHLHFTCWPDHGVPFYAQSLAPFLKRTLTIPHGKSPIVVHCSAGVGRTGTLILCDICLRMATKSGEVDVYYQLRKLREQRINMVDNINQYKLVHLVLLHCLVAPDFTVKCTEEMYKAINEVLSPTKISEQMRYIDETYWQDETMRSVCAKIDVPIVPEKNRFQSIIPDNYARISLKPFPLSDKSSSYINAVKVDGFCVPFKFIVTQYPLNNTLGDFWRLIDQYDISLIICLNELDLSEEIHKFYPELKESIGATTYLEIECTDVLKETYYKIYTLKIYNSDKEDGQRIIKIVQLNKWKYSMLHPETTTELLMAYEEMNSLGKTSKTILVTCLDGTRASGLFTSLCCLVDKIKMEQVCDVCLAVRTVRHGRAEFMRRSEQFSFLYKCGLDYVQSNFAFTK